MRRLILCALACLWSTVAQAGQIIADIETIPSNSIATVTFPQSFVATPVVIAMASNKGGNPAAIRVFDVTPTGFKMVVAEAPKANGPHTNMPVPYMAAESGLTTFPDGSIFYAGVHNTDTFQSNRHTGGGWDTVSLPAGLGTVRAVLTSLQSDNSQAMNTSTSPPNKPAVPWITTVIRNMSNTSFDVAIERSDVASGTLLAEDIGYIVFGASSSSGSFIDGESNTVGWESLSSNSIDGWSNGCDWVNFSQNMGSAPFTLFTKSSRNEADGGWIRSCAIQSTRISLTIDEDTHLDNERSHGNESVIGLVFGAPFIMPRNPATVIVDKTVAEYDATNPGSIPGRDMLYNIAVEHEKGPAVDDIGLTLEKAPSIDTFEAKQQADSPWLYTTG